MRQMLWGARLAGLAVGLTVGSIGCGGGHPVEPRLILVESSPEPVLTVHSPGAEDIKYGFEGGRVVKIGTTYHLFTSEMAGDPVWVKMRLAHWTSPDGVVWTRRSTLFESSGSSDGTDPRAAYWSPLPVFDEDAGRWNLFFVAYHSEPNTDSAFRMNEKGRIVRAVSQAAGLEGIGGPYQESGVVMEPGPDSDPWEGLQGVDSFFPYPLRDGWAALYGSAFSQVLPIRYWRVGLASAPRLEGPWKRLSEMNPSPIEEVFIENPIVEHHQRSGMWLCVYDHRAPDSIGYSFSQDGLHWAKGRALRIQAEGSGWCRDVRTPLGLVAEPETNSYTVFYTGFQDTPDWDRIFAGDFGTTCAVGRIRVRLVWERVGEEPGQGE